ncbi:DNA repair protein [Pseudomonas sp. HMWF031]|nr:DNA repair protein [Pseudomonas sp. HMWF031]
MAASEQQHEQALKRFLDERPELRVELDSLNPLLAQAKGETLAQYRDERLHEAFEAEAERLGLFAWELTLLLTAATPEDYQAQRLEVHREVAEMAGMDWLEYCELYGLTP